MVKTFRILDRLVRFIHTIILSMAALIGLFIMPPIGILLLLYLRSFMQYDASENKSI